MRVIGIICEYNPFHLGHLYQIKKIKETIPDSLIICIFNGTFMQRGEVSIINKWDKTRICLEYGIDMVVELPFVFATQSSDIFAHGALKILNNLHVDTLVFGSESNNVEILKTLAMTQINNEAFDNKVREYLDKGVNYPTALSKTLEVITKYRIKEPNDILAVSYIKEIIKNNYSIEPVAIKRTNDYHGEIISGDIINASLIRKMLTNGNDVSKYVPRATLKYLNDIPSKDKYYSLLKYQIINNIDNLDSFQTVDEGLNNLIKKNIYNANNLDELINSIKTKRYTYNRLNRMFTHILTNFKKEDNRGLEINYVRLLGFNKKGRSYLNKIKKDMEISVVTGYKGINDKIFNIEKRVSYIYSLLIVNSDSYLEEDNKNKPIIFGD
ncbi:MAG: nucleotidyltransferase [Tenericutes bacterium]|nr:nucleotidyltransferase [Mycoplasmatota bacterium]